MKAQHSTEKDDGKSLGDANLLCGDAIVNYKTVQSFGHEEELVKRYEKFLKGPHEASFAGHMLAGFGMGFSQLSMFGLQAAMFACAAVFIEQDYPKLSVEDVFAALFCIMFSAQHLGTSMSLGPDIAKAG
jgi:ATP-binding cassette subfamily B (MDR/TAP) protein 1